MFLKLKFEGYIQLLLLKMSTAMFAEMLVNTKHLMQLTPGSQSYTEK
jgi:hypothetical protein